MFNHVYPPWHKTAQRCLFLIGAILCITLPVAYGKNKSISSQTLGGVLGTFLGLWLLFSLVVRFLVPSPRVESNLPVYTHSPIPVPVILHSPTRSDAVPSSPAIRLHSSKVATPESGVNTSGISGAQVNGSANEPAKVTKGARFADQNDSDDSLSSPLTRPNNNVTFQTRPRGNTTDSTNSMAYPTFAAYRQAQHVNFEAFAQRVKRAFVSQQQQQQQLQLQQQQEEEELKRQQLTEMELQLNKPEDLYLRPGYSRQDSSTNAVVSGQDPATATTTTTLSTRTATGTRSRSASAASMIGDFAERIKSGTLFRRPNLFTNPDSNTNTVTTAGHGDEILQDNVNSKCLKTGAESRSGSGPGIAITVTTASADDHPHPDTAGTDNNMDTTCQSSTEKSAQIEAEPNSGPAFSPSTSTTVASSEPTAVLASSTMDDRPNTTTL
ncbi:hypothetical protein BGZ50_003883 [Haplosporangium sp. Z 11]|nr:hypothetical protein BGZ50_003883 [Haplosporangium sp. Z 11]